MTIHEYINRKRVAIPVATAPLALIKEFNSDHDVVYRTNPDQSRVAGICRTCKFFALYKPQQVTRGSTGNSYPSLSYF